MVKKGDRARLIPRIVAGEVAAVRYNDAAEQLEALLNWHDGEADQQRWFLADELEVLA